MIISHKHKYVFVRTPISASGSIVRELIKNYEGIALDSQDPSSPSFLRAHASYMEFLHKATNEEKQYRVFSTIRNPMDIVVSRYQRFRDKITNERFSDDKIIKRHKWLVRNFLRMQYNYVVNQRASFSDFFLRFYKYPHVNFVNLNHDEFDFIIRFENLEEDFKSAIRFLGIPYNSDCGIQSTNSRSIGKTYGKSKDFFSYYEKSPELISRAKMVFGPFNHEWSYDFPKHWGEIDISNKNDLMYSFFKILFKVHGELIRPNMHNYNNYPIKDWLTAGNK